MTESYPSKADDASIARRFLSRFLLPVGPAIYAGIMYAVGDLRVEHIAIATGTLILGYASRWTRSILVAVAPGILILLGYDLMRYVRPLFVVPSRVLGCPVRDFDLSLFGVGPNLTLSDYFAIHHWLAADLYFAIPYTIFIVITLVYCVYLFHFDRARLSRYLWALALVHAMAFVVWLAMPVAPPWYIRAHGCTIIPGTLPDPAALGRLDRFFGIPYFYEFYVRAPDVFGAIPSLHCAFPAVGLFTAWRAATWRTWPFHVLYLFSMFGASIYLGHHWTMDGLIACVMAAVAVLIVDAVMRWRSGAVAAQ
ncbi:MAG TPA: phosphatase PAP2 family protein [Stellaceae bacterium]|jgi:hypothetical protein|nr:phosphatase PAP2 family protein [Stellaceae bacterium]